MKNHYIPQFYLSSWYSQNEGKIFLYTRDPKKELRLNFRSSKSVGYEKDLYTLEPDGLLNLKEKDYSLEKIFFQKIDDDAAKVHARMIDHGIKSLKISDREVWSKFIESLLERSPNKIKEIELNLEGEIVDELNSAIEKFKSNESRKIARELISNVNISKLIKNSTLWAMQKSITEGELAKEILNYEWLTVEHRNDSEHFITSDNPLLINNGIASKTAFCISIAISPKILLVMMSKNPAFDEEFVIKLAATHSIHMCRQADRYLISSRKLSKAEFTSYESAALEFFLVQKN